MRYEEIRDKPGTMGFRRTEAEDAVLTRGGGDNLSIITLYVDDITTAFEDMETIN